MLWKDPELVSCVGPGPGGLEAVLESAGLAVRRVATAELGAAMEAAGVVVLPYGPYYPAPATAALDAFLARGGLLLTMGPGALAEPLFATPSRWSPAGRGSGKAFDLPLGPGWSLAEGGGADRLELDSASVPGTGLFRAERLEQFAYAGTVLPTPPPENAILAFEARGEPGTERLCLELREKDGSRWKAVVGLTPSWSLHRLHLGNFVPYAGERLGRAGTVIRPDAVNRLLVGMTAAMVGRGTHRFSLRSIRVERAVVSTELLATTPVFAGAEQEVARWFGRHSALPDRLPIPGRPGPPSRHWQADRLVAPEEGPLTPRVLVGGRFMGRSPGPPGTELPTPSSDLGARLRAQCAVERIPLFRVEGGFLEQGQEAAVLCMDRERGARWLQVGLEVDDVRAVPGLAELLADALRLAAGAVLSDGPRPRFRADQGRVVLDVSWWARGSGADVPLELRVAVGGRERWSGPVEARLRSESGRAAEVALLEGLRIEEREVHDLELAIAPAAGAPPVLGPLRFRFDAHQALRSAADFMRDAARESGRLHGHSFIDSRGMRALLGAHEILGDRGYREAALRWGARIVAEQREDGGYRMGYGITSQGEECYVADGGEIALAIARLVSYAEGEERAALLSSLEAYMGFREGFRVPGGGIGVGWCLHDYGRRPVVPLEQLTRIGAPELNPYTIGCSLGAAYLHAALNRFEELEARAAGDAEWLMARAKALHGAYLEGFVHAHAFASDPERRAVYAEFIERTFSKSMRRAGAARRPWWLEGGGRHALDLGGLSYTVSRLGEDPVLRAEMLRAACLMFSPDGPESVLRALRLEPPGQEGWLLICNGTLGLVDAIRPLVSMEGILAGS